MGRRNESPLARPEDVAEFCQNTAEFFCDTEKEPELIGLRVVLGRTAFVSEVQSRIAGLRCLVSADEHDRHEYAFGRTVGADGVFELSLIARAARGEDTQIVPLREAEVTEKILAELLWLRRVTPESR